MTQLEYAKSNKITSLMERVALTEEITADQIRQKVANGEIAIFHNKRNNIVKPVAIGKGLKIKINANIGASDKNESINSIIKQLKESIKCGADTLMDLSIAGKNDNIRREVLKLSSVPVGSCPVYQVFGEAIQKKHNIVDVTEKNFIEIIEKQAEDGISFMGLHCALTLEGIKKSKKRLINMVSRGGGLISCWMAYNKKENPLYTQFETILKILKKHDIVLDISNCLRSGSIIDANDEANIFEMRIVGKLVKKALRHGVSVITEGPGHMPINQIEESIKLQKRLNHFVPMYLLGPSVIDASPGYDHIVAAIGASLAGYAGADFLCTITPSEHLGKPTTQDLEDGIFATKIAGLAVDTARKSKMALQQNYNISKARANLDWSNQARYALTNEKFKKYLKNMNQGKPCSMCGKFCPMRLTKSLKV